MAHWIRSITKQMGTEIALCPGKKAYPLAATTVCNFKFSCTFRLHFVLPNNDVHGGATWTAEPPVRMLFLFNQPGAQQRAIAIVVQANWKNQNVTGPTRAFIGQMRDPWRAAVN